jgi:predicted aldo/keto reductase-like oxidoreductase
MEMILSGMSNMEQREDNIKIFTSDEEGDIAPLSDKEAEALKGVTEVFDSLGAIPCTSCRYCIEENHCPMDIRIPSMFSAYNSKVLFDKINPWMTYDIITSEGHGKASDCIQCGMCEGVCPQHLEIRDLLTKVAGIFE